MRTIPNGVLLLILLIFTAACQQTLVAVEPTLAPTVQPPLVITLRATQTPRTIELPPVTPTVESVPLPTPTLSDTAPEAAAQTVEIPSLLVPPDAVTLPTAIPAANTFVIGQSVQGRDIVAWRFGEGERVLLLVGGIHAGFEGNTVMLVNELIAHFQATPADVLSGMSLVLIPVANPDGLALGREAAGRFNANSVDLNRNWGCEWSPTAYWQERTVDPGGSAFSEPETRALAAWIRDNRPAAVVFYHAAGRGVFAGGCEGDHGSAAFAAVYGEASGYPYGAAWSAYPVTGTAPTWVDSLGIPAVDLELSSTQQTEFLPNLRGIMAAQCWLMRDSAAAGGGCD